MLSYRKIALVGVSLISLSTPAFAAEVAVDDSAESAPIIVEARRKDEDIQDVPQVVNAVTSQQLDKLNIRDMKDVASVVPGLQLSPPANGIGGVATLRGVNFDVNASGNNGTVEFYVNDAPTQTATALQGLFDIGQIEVLRGPQGTLRGRASPSGSITIAPRAPDLSQPGAAVNATVNDIKGWNVQAAINVPVIADILGVRLAGIADENEGNRVRSLNSAVDPKVRTRGGRVSVLFKPVDGLKIQGTYFRLQRKSAQFSQVESANLATGTSLPSGSTLITADDRLAVQQIPGRFDQNAEVFNAKAEWNLGPVTLNYVGNWRHTKTVTYDPQDKGNFYNSTFLGSALSANDPFVTGFATAASLKNLTQATNSREDAQSHEIRLSSSERLFGMMDFVLGAMSYKSTPPFELWAQTPLWVDINGNQTPTPALQSTVLTFPGPTYVPGFLGVNNSLITQENTRSLERSVFGNVTLHFGDATELSGGLRYINYRNHSEKYITTADQTGLHKNPLGVQITDEFNPLIYSVSLKHRFNDNLMVYANTASSWRASAQTNGIIDRTDVYPYGTMAGLLHLPPETSKSYELGVKSEWLDRKLTLNVSYYHQNFKNYFYSAPNIQVAQRTALVNGTATTYGTNDVFALATMSPALAVGVPVKVDGVEAEFSYRPTSHFSIGGSVSYSIGKIQNGTIPCNAANVHTASDLLNNAANPTHQQVIMCSGVNSRAGVDSPFSGNLQAEYNMPLGGSEGFLRSLVTFKGDSQNDPANPYDDIKSYALVNLYAGLRAPNGAWEINLFAKNVFNTQRVLTRNANAYTADAQFLSLAFANLGGFPQTSNYRGITMTDPREFGVNVKFALGSR